MTVHNFSGVAQQVKLDLRDRSERTERQAEMNLERLVEMLAGAHSNGKKGVHSIALDALSYRWYRVGTEDSTLDRAPY